MKKEITNEETFAIEVLNLKKRVNNALKKEGIYTLEDILKCKNSKLERIVLKNSKTDFEEILKFKENPNEYINYKFTLRLREILNIYRKIRTAAKASKIRCMPQAMKKAFFTHWSYIPNELILSKIESEKGVFDEEFIQEIKSNKYPKFKELFSATANIFQSSFISAIFNPACRPYLSVPVPDTARKSRFFLQRNTLRSVHPCGSSSCRRNLLFPRRPRAHRAVGNNIYQYF